MTTVFYSFPEHVLHCHAVSTTNFTSNYSQGPNGTGIGATLTATSAGVTTFDGQALLQDQSVLIMGQTNNAQNGIYTVTVAGTASIATVLTRRADFQSGGQLRVGAYVTIDNGTTYAGSVFVLTGTTPQNIGVDAITFASPTTGAGTFLQISNNLSDVASASTSRTNLGLGTAATKAASDGTKATVASVTGAVTSGAVAVFADTSGTVNSDTTKFRAQVANNGGGSATVTITDANITTSSIVVASIQASTNAVSIQKVTPNAGSITVLLSGDPGASTKIQYISVGLAQ